MSEDPTSQAMFLEHYVSPGPSDLLPAPAAEPAASARGQKAVGGVTLPALPPGSLSTTLHTRSASMVAGGAPPISARGTPAQLSVASGGAAAVTSLLGSLSPGMDSAPGMSLEDAFAVRTRTASVPPQPSGPSGEKAFGSCNIRLPAYMLLHWTQRAALCKAHQRSACG